MNYQDYKPQRFTNEQIQAAKDFSIIELAANYGLLNGAKKAKQGYFILNPFESEKTASFLVNSSASKNYAKAFNSGKRYNPISFSMEYENIGFVQAVKKILNLPSDNSFVKSAAAQNTPKTTKESDLKPLTDAKKINALRYYLKKVRFVSPKLAKLYGLQYLGNGKYYYLAVANDKGGFECFNNSKIKKFRKMCFGAKTITTILAKTQTNNFTVFEAFLDYLSFLELHQIESLKTNVIILNGTGQTEKSIHKIINFNPQKVFLVLDNDKAGFDSKELFKKEFGSKIIDLSNSYSKFMQHDCKDVNEYLTRLRRFSHTEKLKP